MCQTTTEPLLLVGESSALLPPSSSLRQRRLLDKQPSSSSDASSSSSVAPACTIVTTTSVGVLEEDAVHHVGNDNDDYYYLATTAEAVAVEEEDWHWPTRSTLLRQRWFSWICRTLPILLWDAVRLAAFVVLLAPAFGSFFIYYMTCDRTVVPYQTGPDRRCRHTLDVYGATPTSRTSRKPNKPVLVFFTGGAWVIGYKMWGAFLARVFCALGVLVVVPDYPNYPQVTVPQMVADSEAALEFVLDSIEQYGGDPEQVVVAGQSAGGHLVACVLLKKALALLQQNNTNTTTSNMEGGFHPNRLKGFCIISAPSDVQAMTTNFQKHGLDQSFVQSLFGVLEDADVCMDDYDPQRLVEQLQLVLQQKVITQQQPCHENHTNPIPSTMADMLRPVLPFPVSVFHGTADQTVPYEVSERFAHSLKQCGLTADYIAYEGWSHTDPILEAIMMADHRFHADLFRRVVEWTRNEEDEDDAVVWPAVVWDDGIPECQPLCPAVLIRAARFCNPF